MNLREYAEEVESLNKLAKRAGVHPATVYRALEKSSMSLETARKLIRACKQKALNFDDLAAEHDGKEAKASA